MLGSSDSRGNMGSAAPPSPSQEPSSETGNSPAKPVMQLLASVGGAGVVITGAVVAVGLLARAGRRSRGNTGSAAASPPSQGPSSETGSSPAKLVVQVLALVGGAGVVITGAVVAVGLLVHAGHLTMLGLPLFPMSPFAYSQLALQFGVETARTSVSHPWLIGGWLVSALVFVGVFAAYPSLGKRKCFRSDGIVHRCVHSPVAYPLRLLAIVVAAGLLLYWSTRILTGSRSTRLLWPISKETTRAAEEGLADQKVRARDLSVTAEEVSEALAAQGAFGEEPGRVPLSSDGVRWCLYHRNAEGTALTGDPKRAVDAARHGSLEDAKDGLANCYACLVGGTIVVLLLYIATRRGRRRLTAPPADHSGRRRSSLLVAADVLLEIPAVVILALLLMALPANYGALMMTTSYPVVSMVRMEKGASEESKCAFLVSPATSDAKSVCVLRMELRSELGEKTGYSYVLETHSFDPDARMRVVDYGDILQSAQVQMVAASMENVGKTVAARLPPIP